MKAIHSAAIIGLTALSTAVVADHDDRWYVAPMGGAVVSNFGDFSIDFGPALYLGVGKPISDKWNIELSTAWSSLDTDDGEYERQGWLGVNGQYFFSGRDNDLNLFGLAGMTATRIKYAGDTAYSPSAELGGGATKALSENMDFRADLRYRLDFNRGDEGAGNDIFYDWVITAGINLKLGERSSHAAPAPAPAPVAPTASAVPATLPSVTFPLDSAQLTASSKLTLDDVARVMNDNPDMEVAVVGNADDSGPADYNLQLSERRVQAVVDYLVGRGVDSARLSQDAQGESKPVASNATPEGRQQNRRVDLELQ